MSEANMQLTDFLPAETLSKYRKLGWTFQLDEFKTEDGLKADLAFKSPRMSSFELSLIGPISERTLLDEEAWNVAREYMEKNPLFQIEFKEKFLNFFRHNKKVDPESVIPVIEFKIKSSN